MAERSVAIDSALDSTGVMDGSSLRFIDLAGILLDFASIFSSFCEMSRSKAIFVGNIPYDKTETQMIDILSEVGTVVNFRLVFDRETGKPKGYGFCSYQDHETAASAVRNLNNYDVGGRQLRIDFAEQDKEDNTPMDANQQIQNVVGQDPRAIAEALSYLKSLAHTNPELANQLLVQEPQLAMAILQALIKMKLVSQESMQRLLSAQGLFLNQAGLIHNQCSPYSNQQRCQISKSY